MLDYKLLDRKPKLKNEDDEQYVDLLAKTYDDGQMFGIIPVITNKYYVARPDLVSLSMYGDDKYADIICKLNGISNPFELNDDVLLLIPNVDYLQDCLMKSVKESELIKDPETDSIQQVNKRNMQKKKSDDRSPNEQVIGDSNFIIDKSLGIVFY